jgi:hypothetical protein
MACKEIFINCYTGCLVNLDKIKVHPIYNKIYSLSDIVAMATSLINIGYSFPIILTKNLYILDGQLRYVSLNYLKTKSIKIPCDYVIPEKVPVVISEIKLEDFLQFSKKCIKIEEKSKFPNFLKNQWI